MLAPGKLEPNVAKLSDCVFFKKRKLFQRWTIPIAQMSTVTRACFQRYNLVKRKK